MNKEPIFKKKEAFLIVGVERYTSEGICGIQEAWGEFSKRSTEIQHTVSKSPFGIEDYSRDFDMNKGGFPKFYYIASLEVTKLEDIPVGMTGREVAAANYSVFNFKGPIGGLPDFFKYIYGEWLPSSGYSMDPKLSLDFEHYPKPVMDMDAAEVEIWVPIVKG